MDNPKEIYFEALKSICSEVGLKYFPQVEASELLYRVISLEDIYLPLSLTEVSKSSYEYGVNTSRYRAETFQEIMDRIDKKIAAIEQSVETNSMDVLLPSLANKDQGLRILIQAAPGSGKTTFCKKLTLAIIGAEDAFFAKYNKENNLSFCKESLPVLVNCKHLVDFSISELKNSTMVQILYKLCLHGYGEEFASIKESDFKKILGLRDNKKLTLILDGWDEILDPKIKRAFSDNLNQYINDNPNDDIVITIRSSYDEPMLTLNYTNRLVINPLTDDEIREFCSKWCKTILNADQNCGDVCFGISEQILHSREPQIKMMMRNPLDLSLLLTVSKNDGRIPENRAELFEQLVKLYIYWSTQKGTGCLSPKSLRVLLAYIASIMTKRKYWVIRDAQLKKILMQAMRDLDGRFVEELSSIGTTQIIKELIQTGILKRSYTGVGLSFVETRSLVGHRQMQEYLTAYAISAQYSDEEYNSMSPCEIFKNKYSDSNWREIIIFVTLMDNGRDRQGIIHELITRIEKFEDVDEKQLLFEIVASGVDIGILDRHQIYDALFSDSITIGLIDSVAQMVLFPNKYTNDFIDYINIQFESSVDRELENYGYAKAAIESALAIERKESPFVRAENLIRSNSDIDIIAGTQMFLILSWCKQVAMRNIVFSQYYSSYEMSEETKNLYINLVKEHHLKRYIIESVRDVILANYVSFFDIFTEKDVVCACEKLTQDNNDTYYSILLSMAPVFVNKVHSAFVPDEALKKQYLDALEEGIKLLNSEAIIYSFSIAAAIGCWSEEELKRKWDSICDLFSSALAANTNARFSQLLIEYRKSILLAKNADEIVSHFILTNRSDDLQWSIKRTEPKMVNLTNGWINAAVSFQKEIMSDDTFLWYRLIDMTGLFYHNNLAYLLRRGEATSFKIALSPPMDVSPEQLLQLGISEHYLLENVNYALLISGICKNKKGDYKKGKEYLLSVKNDLNCKVHYVSEVVDWWRVLAVKRHEFEGFVVLSWLVDIGILDIHTHTNRSLCKDLTEYFNQYGLEYNEIKTLYNHVMEDKCE